jgi:inward rectifier potassium channel
MITLPLPSLLFLGLLANAFTVLVFALVYFVHGTDCFEIAGATDSEFTFLEMLWLSVHTFTSVGYGSVFPTCAGPQVAVFLEHYASIVTSSIFIACLLFKFLLPRPLVRFSSVILVLANVDPVGKGQRRGHLSLRVVRESFYPLLDCELTMECTIRAKTGSSSKAYTAPLRVVIRTKPELNQWTVWHCIDSSSPLHGREMADVYSIRAQLSVFDSAHRKQVRLHHRYTQEDIILEGSRFVDMVTPPTERRPEIVCDHSKLDLFEVDPSWEGTKDFAREGHNGVGSLERSSGSSARRSDPDFGPPREEDSSTLAVVNAWKSYTQSQVPSIDGRGSGTPSDRLRNIVKSNQKRIKNIPPPCGF